MKNILLIIQLLLLLGKYLNTKKNSSCDLILSGLLITNWQKQVCEAKLGFVLSSSSKLKTTANIQKPNNGCLIMISDLELSL